MNAATERTTRERILEVAETLLGERGYHGTRLHVIAERVGIQKASLFHYFPSKEHLYRAVLDQGLGETEKVIREALASGEDRLGKLRALVESYVDLVAAHPERTKILLRQSLGDVPNPGQRTHEAERLLDLVVGYIAEGQRAGVLARMDPLALVLSVVGMVAFFFTSAPVLSPEFGEPGSMTRTERVKRHVVDVVECCLSQETVRGSVAKLAVG
jgi:AcrR family transcriptional regulator